MWAPADLFGPGLSTFLLPLKGIVTYFYEHPMVLAIAIILVGLLIAAVTMVQGRRAKRT